MSSLEDFMSIVNTNIKQIDVSDLSDIKGLFWDDAQAFIETSKSDIINYSKALAAGELSQDEYLDLLNGNKELMKMHALTMKGIAKAKIEKLRNMVVDAIYSAAKASLL